jgi:hypothetical protein
MNSRFGLFLCGILLAVCACEPVAVQYPPGSAQYPYPNPSGPTTPQAPQVSSSQRWQHAWNKAMEGVAMGGSIGGPYGAGGGLVIGLITGLITADSYFGAINRQIYSEHQKDQQLEAAIEQELAKQRGLENQIASATATSSTASQPEVRPAASATPAEKSVPPGITKPTKPPENVTVSSLGKPQASQQPSPNPFRNVEVRDINRDGIPDLWIYYNPHKPGEIMRQEESTKGDGRVDTWSYFKDGQLVRRDVDVKGLGRPDTVYYYANDMIVREERDEIGQGRMTYRANYQNGRLAQVEKDTSGTGRPDLWITYDATRDGEVVIKEERDLNGDGAADLWSYYDNGRLTRRDVSAVGLEILSKQEQLPAPPAEITRISNPGN